MYNNSLFRKFCEDRNIKSSTVKGYVSALNLYTKFHELSLEELIDEANRDEANMIPLKNRYLKDRLVSYRNYLLKNNMSNNTIKTYFSKVKSFYVHQEIEIPNIPDIKYCKEYESNYLDLPTIEDIRRALDISSLPFKALILFMSSSGTAKAETLSLTVGDFIDGACDYYTSTRLNDILDELSCRDDVVPTIYLKRIKTDKFYYTFCSPEASSCIVRYLKMRENLSLDDKLFPFSGSVVMSKFQNINDEMGWGFKGKYRFFRSHALRKFHASNIMLGAEYVDALQGRGKNSVHESYIKTNPLKLKEMYVKNMHNVMIYYEPVKSEEMSEEIHITINVFVADNQINL